MDDGMDRIYREHAKTVYRYMMSITHDTDIAEEITQETFYRALNSVDRYDGSCKITVWLCQIAKHIWLQELGKRAKYKSKELGEDIRAETSTEETAVFASERTALYKAIHTLGEPMREVVFLRLSELSFAEIGEIMARSENWARTTFYRGKQKLMEVLSDA